MTEKCIESVYIYMTEKARKRESERETERYGER